jgi:hypothetical protein
MEPSAEVKDTLLRFYEAISSRDYPVFRHLLSQQDGVLFIGTDPDEWWPDYKTITEVFGAELEEMGGASLNACALQAYSEGSVGWFEDRPIIRLTDGTEIPTRLTGVCHQENGGWKIVQWHASLGVPAEEDFGPLTTSSTYEDKPK